MILTREGESLIVDCPAKVNLFLELHGVRPDGYHEIETVMQAVTIYDRVTLLPRGDGRLTFACSDPDLPLDGGNLAFRAAQLMRREFGLPSGVSVNLEKAIPYGAGLGGGSSDAAGVLAGLNCLFNLGAETERLSALAAEIGSDVAFFLYGGTALCTGRGEKVTPVPSRLISHYVICHPEKRLATREVYRNVARWGLTSGDRNASFTLISLASGDGCSLCASLFNRLERAAVELSPEVASAKSLLTAAASRPALVSGSGSAVYVLADSAEQATQVAEEARRLGAGRVLTAQTEAHAA